MNAGKIRPGCGNGEVFDQRFVVLLATDVELAKHLMHMIGIRGNREQMSKLRPGDLAPRGRKFIMSGMVAGMSDQPTLEGRFGIVVSVFVYGRGRLSKVIVGGTMAWLRISNLLVGPQRGVFIADQRI